MPYDTYRLYQIERAKSSAEVQHADEQAARLISAVSSLLRGLTRPVRAIRRPYPRPPRSACPAQRGARPAQQDTGDRLARARAAVTRAGSPRGLRSSRSGPAAQR
jgi:hypothetical protein